MKEIWKQIYGYPDYKVSNYGGEKHPMYGRPRIGKTILCIETGKIYHSTREAAADVGVAPNGIVKCCNGKRNICAGYHWRYLD